MFCYAGQVVSAAVRASTSRVGGGGFRTDVEGLRAIAVLAVALWHAGLAGIPGGFTGVDVFFVLSGYLITGLLLAEYEASSRIRLVHFYARRVRRLLPAAVLMMSVTLLACLVMLGPRELLVAASSGRAAAVYLSNVWFARDTGNYFAQTGAGSPFVHTWSLAVEEQFYLVWPILILLCLKVGKSRITLIAVLSTLSAASFAACLLLSYRDPQTAFYHSPLRAWQFGVGALAVLLIKDRFRHPHRYGVVLGWSGLTGVLVSFFLLNHDNYPGWRGLLPTMSTALVLIGTPPPLLSLRPLQWLGGLSYSWYLWHWPMLTLAAAVVQPLTTVGKSAALATALLVAATTHYLIENPIRFNGFLAARPALNIWMGGALTLLGFGLGSGARWFSSELARDPLLASFLAASGDDARPSPGCYTEADSSDLATCAAGAVNGAPHIVLFGDSHAMHWFPPMDRVAASRGWKLTPVTKPGCPSTDARRDSSSTEDLCVAWRENAFKWITTVRPDLVVLTNIYPTELPQGPLARSSALDVYRKGITRTLLRFARNGIPVLLIRDSPHQDFNIPNCLARSARTNFFPREACRMSAVDALRPEFFEADRRAAVGLPKVSLVDLSSEYCSGEYCDVERPNLVLYRDHQHFTLRYALTLASLVEPELRRMLGQ